MQKLLLALPWLSAVFVGAPALACGGGFGGQVEIKPEQTIVLTHRDGEEAYVFQPHFCGMAKEFGLILPVPAPLTSNPTLAAATLYSELDELAAPRVETVDVCVRGGLLGASDSKAASGGFEGTRSSDDGVDVIATGKVGYLSWELLRADSSTSLTDWLDARKFPYPATAKPAFEHYVGRGWYFVAFQVDTGQATTPSGFRVCGDFGPISLSFPSPQPVIPARIAAAGVPSSTFTWRVYAISKTQQTLSQANLSAHQVSQEQRYAAELTAERLAKYEAVAAIARRGEWLTETQLTFYSGNLSDDIALSPTPTNVPYQRVTYVEREVDCGVFGCALAPSRDTPRWLCGGAAGLGLIAVLLQLRRRKFKG